MEQIQQLISIHMLEEDMLSAGVTSDTVLGKNSSTLL